MYDEISDKADIQKLLSFSEKMTLMMNDITNELISLTDKKIIIPNIGITYNNKITSIIMLYKANNMYLSRSLIEGITVKYLNDVVVQALSYLDKSVNLMKLILNPNLNEKEKAFLAEISMDYVDRYTILEKNIASFDIGKDIYTVIQHEKELFDKDVKEWGNSPLYSDFSVVIDSTNKELPLLGFNDVYVDPELFESDNVK